MAKYLNKISVKAVGTVSITPVVVRAFALRNLQSALYFSEKSGEIEKDNEKDVPQRESYITGAIVLAVTSVEANFNEAGAELSKKFQKSGNNTEAKKIVKFLEKIERESLIKKHQLFLGKYGTSKFDKNSDLYKHMELLASLRNALVHSRPIIVEGVGGKLIPKENKYKVLGEDLLNVGFPLNPYVPASQDDFPLRIRSHGCANWSVQTALNFIKEYRKNLTLPNQKFVGPFVYKKEIKKSFINLFKKFLNNLFSK